MQLLVHPARANSAFHHRYPAQLNTYSLEGSSIVLGGVDRDGVVCVLGSVVSAVASEEPAGAFSAGLPALVWLVLSIGLSGARTQKVRATSLPFTYLQMRL